MGIRKSRDTHIDIDKMFSDADIQIEKENSEADEQLKTIRASTAMLRAHAEKLCECVEAEKKATTALNAAADSCDNAVTGICNAILAAQQRTLVSTRKKSFWQSTMPCKSKCLPNTKRNYEKYSVGGKASGSLTFG